MTVGARSMDGHTRLRGPRGLGQRSPWDLQPQRGMRSRRLPCAPTLEGHRWHGLICPVMPAMVIQSSSSHSSNNTPLPPCRGIPRCKGSRCNILLLMSLTHPERPRCRRLRLNRNTLPMRQGQCFPRRRLSPCMILSHNFNNASRPRSKSWPVSLPSRRSICLQLSRPRRRIIWHLKRSLRPMLQPPPPQPGLLSHRHSALDQGNIRRWCKRRAHRSHWRKLGPKRRWSEA